MSAKGKKRLEDALVIGREIAANGDEEEPRYKDSNHPQMCESLALSKAIWQEKHGLGYPDFNPEIFFTVYI